MHFFFSYSHSVKQDVVQVMDQLRAAGHKVCWGGNIPANTDWWSTILDEIEGCQVFVFAVSKNSVQSAYCLEELRYAIDCHRPIVSLVMDNDTDYAIPSEAVSMQHQWLRYDGNPAQTSLNIVEACSRFDLRPYTDIPGARPAEPHRSNSSPVKQFQQAVSLAEDGLFEEAIKHFQDVMYLDTPEWAAECEEWIKRLTLYASAAEFAEHEGTILRARTKWIEYRKYFNASFDPLKLKERLFTSPFMGRTMVVPSPPVLPPAETLTQPRLQDAAQAVIALIGEPFEWIHIKGGQVRLETKSEHAVADFAIARYALTNRQYQIFVDAVDGYCESKWWDYSNEAQAWREAHNRPLDTAFAGDELPRTNVCWYEAVAFTRWLSARVTLTPKPSLFWRREAQRALSLQITLPTEQQWQRAAIEDNGWQYPWGNDFVEGVVCFNTKMPVAVTDYPGGASPSGVLQMSGNVWEWCLNNYHQPEDTSSQAIVRYRTLRGGSWGNDLRFNIRADYRNGYDPASQKDKWGFRLALNY